MRPVLRTATLPLPGKRTSKCLCLRLRMCPLHASQGLGVGRERSGPVVLTFFFSFTRRPRCAADVLREGHGVEEQRACPPVWDVAFEVASFGSRGNLLLCAGAFGIPSPSPHNHQWSRRDRFFESESQKPDFAIQWPICFPVGNSRPERETRIPHSTPASRMSRATNGRRRSVGRRFGRKHYTHCFPASAA